MTERTKKFLSRSGWRLFYNTLNALGLYLLYLVALSAEVMYLFPYAVAVIILTELDMIYKVLTDKK